MKKKIEKPFVGISWKRDKKYAISIICLWAGIFITFYAVTLMNKDVWNIQTGISIALGATMIIVGSTLLEKTKAYKKTPMYKMSLSMKGKNDPKLTRNLIISQIFVFLLFVGLLAFVVVLENKGLDKDIPYFDNYWGFAFFNIFPLFFYVMAYFGIVKKFFISADYLKYFLFIGVFVMVFQGHLNAALIAGAVIGIVAFFVFSPGKSKNIKTKEDQDKYATKVGYLFLILGVIVFLFFLNLDIWSTKTYGGGIFALPALKSLGLVDVYDPFEGKYSNPLRLAVESGSSHTYIINGLQYKIKIGHADNTGAKFVINDDEPGYWMPVGTSLDVPIGGELFVEKIYFDDRDHIVLFWIGNE